MFTVGIYFGKHITHLGFTFRSFASFYFSTKSTIFFIYVVEILHTLHTYTGTHTLTESNKTNPRDL